jgi:hypothetical protein
MSIEECKKLIGVNTQLSDIVKINGRYYLVDSVLTLDAWYETIVYRCNKRKSVVSWSEMHVEHHYSFEQMRLRHKYIINNLEEVL